jgi:nucleoside-diphosphate-sugar epimerase
LKKAFGEYFDQLELVEADLCDEKSMIQAMEGSTYIVHTASPFPIVAPKDENELIKPAVEGTLAVMKAARINKVKRVVITSSVAAIYKTGVEGQSEFSEKDWTDCKVAQPYEKSKTLAELAAWDFIKNLPEDEKFEVATINPGLVIGPNLNEA